MSAVRTQMPGELPKKEQITFRTRQKLKNVNKFGKLVHLVGFTIGMAILTALQCFVVNNKFLKHFSLSWYSSFFVLSPWFTMLEKTYPTICQLLQVLEYCTYSLALDNFAKRCMTLHVVITVALVYNSISQPPGHGPVPGPGINYTGPREVLLEFVILVF